MSQSMAYTEQQLEHYFIDYLGSKFYMMDHVGDQLW